MHFLQIKDNSFELRCHIRISDDHLLAVTLYLVPLTVAEYLAPTAITALTYGRIWCHIWKFTHQGPRLLQRTKHQVPRSKIKIVKILMLANAVDLITISSYYGGRFAHLANAFPIESVDYFLIFASLVFFSWLVKPVIYLFLNGNFRRGCREVLCWNKLRCYRQELYTVTNMSVFAKRNHVAVNFGIEAQTTHLSTEPMLQVRTQNEDTDYFAFHFKNTEYFCKTGIRQISLKFNVLYPITLSNYEHMSMFLSHNSHYNQIPIVWKHW